MVELHINTDRLFTGPVDYISVVMRKEKTLVSYKSAFIKILFGETLSNNAA